MMKLYNINVSKLEEAYNFLKETFDERFVAGVTLAEDDGDQLYLLSVYDRHNPTTARYDETTTVAFAPIFKQVIDLTDGLNGDAHLQMVNDFLQYTYYDYDICDIIKEIRVFPDSGCDAYMVTFAELPETILGNDETTYDGVNNGSHSH